MSEHRKPTKLSPIDESARKAGSVESAGPAREQIVIRDKRKIDGAGRPKTAESGTGPSQEKGSQAGQTDSTPVPDAQPTGAGGTATGQPGTPTEQVAPVGPDGAAAGTGRKSATKPAEAAKAGHVEARRSGSLPGPAGGVTVAQPGAEAGVKPDAKTDGAKTAGAKTDGAKTDGAKTGEAKTGEAKTGEAKTAEGEAGVAEVGGELAEGGQPVPAALGAELAALRSELDERLRDLQRVTAEFANYRKRVERDRGAMAEQAFATVLLALLPILDDLDRARDHGDLVGPFGAVAEQLTTALGKFGLTGFGEVGDAFDPTRHEAVTHRRSAEVSEPTCVEVMRRGYMLGDRLLRAALVSVADPE